MSIQMVNAVQDFTFVHFIKVLHHFELVMVLIVVFVAEDKRKKHFHQIVNRKRHVVLWILLSINSLYGITL